MALLIEKYKWNIIPFSDSKAILRCTIGCMAYNLQILNFKGVLCEIF